MPNRIQLRRTNGWRKPEGAVVVSRPSKWGNPFRVGDPHPTFGGQMSRGEAVECYRHSLHEFIQNRLPSKAHCDAWRGYHSLMLGLWVVVHAKGMLAGKDLCCWCPLDQPCHADVLLELANA